MNIYDDLLKVNFINNIIYSALIETSALYNIDQNDLIHNALLQLPKYTLDQLTKKQIVYSEIKKIVIKMMDVDVNDFNGLLNVNIDIDLKELSLKSVPDDLVKYIFTNFHYLGYPRKNSISLGLFYNNGDEAKLLSIVTLSKFDLSHISNYLPNNLQPSNTLVLSRVYSSDWSPKNTISYMLSKVVSWLKHHKPNIKLLFTYLNPNLGFTGRSLKASNWMLFAKETNIKYMYLDGNYVTLRNLRNMTNHKDVNEIKLLMGDRLTFSKIKLLPLEIYAYPMHNKIRLSINEPITVEKIPSIV